MEVLFFSRVGLKTKGATEPESASGNRAGETATPHPANHARSKIAAIPWPPPMHMVTKA